MRLRTPAVLALALAVSSCSLLEKKEPPPCPPIFILGDAATVTKFQPGKGRDLTDVEVEGEVVGFSGGCVYDEHGAIVDIQVAIGAKRGPANATRKAKLEYFIAIPHFFPSPEAKAVMPIEVEFPEGVNAVRHIDEVVTMRIPVKDREVINKFEIYIGFQTTPEELEYNRKLRAR